MDPRTEIATLVVSYLWALRELFPDKYKVAQFDLARLPGAVQGDVALLARLRNVAQRQPEERWSAAPAAEAHQRLPWSRLERQVSLDDELERIVNRRLRSTAGPGTVLQRLRASVVEAVGLNYAAPQQSDYEQLVTKALGDFIAHAKGLIEEFGTVSVRRDPGGTDSPASHEITRESLTDRVVAQMLQERRLDHVARLLEDRPILLRTLDSNDELLKDPAYPRQLLAACDDQERAVPFPLLLHAEIDEIEASRLRRRSEAIPVYVPTPPLRRAFEHGFLGISFSGGGIRSATFNLGILQGLASRGWLRHCDYLSTVSGGGYIGAWLLAWIKRRGSVLSVQDSLRGYGSCDPHGSLRSSARNPDPGAEHVRPIRLLREYSNYLAPRFSALSADAWTIVSIWMRNTVVNLLVLTLALMAVLLSPRLLGVAFDGSGLDASMTNASMTASLWTLTVTLGVASVLIGLNLRSFDDPAVTTQSQSGFSFAPRLRPSARGDTPILVVTTVVVPGLVAMFFAVRVLWEYAATYSSDDEVSWWGYTVTASWVVFGWAFSLLTAGLATTAATGRFWGRPGPGETRANTFWLTRALAQVPGFAWNVLWSLTAAAVGAFVIKESWDHLFPVLLADTHRGMWLAIAFGPVLLLAATTLVIVIYLGLEGLSAPDERREWWSRLGAWLGLLGSTWAVLTCISYFAPYLVIVAGLYAGTLGIGWSSITALGAWLAASGRSNGINLPLDKNPWSSAVITAAPYIFMAGFLVTVAMLDYATLDVLNEHHLLVFRPTFTNMEPLPFSFRRYADTYWAMVEPHSIGPLWVLFGLLMLATLLARRVDVNEFSMHHFYKNRLVRAYLGASRVRLLRRPNAFTGLDMDDDIKLWRFTTTDPSTPDDERTDCRASFTGPFPIVNATLNITSGADLAWQERKGQSFVFTPLHCGFDFATKQTAVAEKVTAQFAYRPTKTFANSTSRHTGIESGLGIGTAIAISGAAANPNAGYHSSPAVAFLLTIFNARLGWWIGNPLRQHWRSPSPRFGLFYMLSKFGFAGVEQAYVNLSDGGHFDNMGLYELVRRRCRYIIVCDGEQDDRYSFNGMAAAIRKCRVDFGVVIDISMKAIVPGPDGYSADHVAVGAINYPGQGCGTLVYIKASLTGDEPPDVKEYRDGHREFPHQTTGDQFFDESQFESYRVLGQHIADQTFPDWPVASDVPFDKQLDDLIRRLPSRLSKNVSPTSQE